jgi:DNA-binding CsgD family transcriptional regulator
VETTDLLERGRRSFEARAWKAAYEALEQADEAQPLEAYDLELLARSAYLLGREEGWLEALGRAHERYLEDGEALRAVRCAFWAGTHLAVRGELGRASGWLGRAHRLLEREEEECAEHGYLLLPTAYQHDAMGDLDGAVAAATRAAALGERFDDPDLFALAVHVQGQMLVKQGRVQEGMRLLDEAMLTVTARNLSPIVTGIVYCGVIAGCQEVYELRRAQEWTEALTQWCDEQPELMAFTGRCRVHRAEIMHLRGAWVDALNEARRAGERFAQAMNRAAAAQSAYRQGEVHRLRGDFAAAEGAYREANDFGWEPQPGLALLRLAQGNTRAAAAAIRRVVGGTDEPLRRASLLPASVEILLAAGAVEEARAAAAELEQTAATFATGMLGALAAQARGETDLASGDIAAALGPLRRAAQAWQELEAPYETARSRVSIGLACRALGDEETAVLELEGARAAFERLGAAPDLARLDSLTGRAADVAAHGLTARELEVLRLVAAGKSNREIASELVISEHTVARHVQNIFGKLRVSSRAAAGAFAFQHDLV